LLFCNYYPADELLACRDLQPVSDFGDSGKTGTMNLYKEYDE